MTAGELLAALAQVHPDTPVALDDGREYRAALSAGTEHLDHIDDDEQPHEVACLVVLADRDGRSLDQGLAHALTVAHTPEAGSRASEPHTAPHGHPRPHAHTQETKP